MAQTSHLRKVAVVVGASSGIGAVTADRLAGAGWTVIGTARRFSRDENRQDVSAPASQTPNAMPGANAAARLPRGRWEKLPMDVTDQASVDAGISEIMRRHGRIDALVQCAGFAIAGSIEDVSPEEAERQFAVNYFGAVRLIRAAAPIMRAQGGGRIVVVGSIGGLIALPFLGHYSASKFAIDGMVEALRYEVQPFGIHVSAVHPGDIRTEFPASQEEAGSAGTGSPYFERFRATVDLYDKLVAEARGPEVIARAIEKLLNQKKPPVRVSAGTFIERAGVSLKSVLPQHWFEAMIRQHYRL
ncbi:MAG: SDR family oxidoreductase [Hyphomicrobiaceae bacterium]